MPRLEFNQEQADLILEEIAKGRPLTKIVRENPGLPSYSTILKWLSNGENPEFEIAYVLAREHQADTLTDEIMEDAEEAEKRLTGDRSDNARVQAVRLRIDTKKWVASKMKPNKYGDKLGVGGLNGGPLEVSIVNYAKKEDEEPDNDPV